MISHGEWFNHVRNLEKLDYVEIADDTSHPIAQVSKVPLAMQDGRTKYLLDVLHVPSITKRLFSRVQIVEQGLQVIFTPTRLFIKDFK